MTEQQFEKLRRFKIGSWAIWDKGSKESLIDFFRLKLDKLHGNVIFLALNRSKKRKGKNVYTNKNYEFNNFHNVKRLQRCIRGNNLIGSYITDFYKDIDPVAKHMNNKTFRQKRLALKMLFKQIDIFKVKDNKKLIIICFGDDVFSHLRDSLKLTRKDEESVNLNKIEGSSKIDIRKFKTRYKNYELSVTRVCHYSNNNRGKIFEEKLTKQLDHINQIIAS
jgi:hypothetical protein